MSKRLTKELVQKWLKEADRWEVGHGVVFRYKGWDIGIRKVDDAFESYRFGLSGRRKETKETISRRYWSIEDALLHTVNGFNENANVRNHYDSLGEALCDPFGWFAQVNTLVSYLYRDADNYKVNNECVIRGEMTEEQEKRIIESLDEEVYFVPACVGMPEEKFGSETEADHPWFEWCGIEPTSRKPTLDIDAEELTARFEKAGNGWHEVRTAPNDGRIPYCVTIQETMSRTVIVWAHERIEAETIAQDLCNAGYIELDCNDFVDRQCTCDGVATTGDLNEFKEYRDVH